jgi:hypothetical protein
MGDDIHEGWTPASPQEERRFFRALFIMTTVNLAGILCLIVIYWTHHSLLGLPFLLSLTLWIFIQVLARAL